MKKERMMSTKTMMKTITRKEKMIPTPNKRRQS